MPSLLPLVKMELNGIGICCKDLERIKELLDTTLTELETRAFILAGHEFSMASPKDVAKVHKSSYLLENSKLKFTIIALITVGLLVLDFAK